MLKIKSVKAIYPFVALIFISMAFTAHPNASPFNGKATDKDLLTNVNDHGNLHISANKKYTRSERSKSGKVFASNVKMNKQGLKFVRNYLKNSNKDLRRIQNRSRIPFYIIDSVFSRYGLPVELKYLAVVESELKPSALSRVGARGPWQLMPETARILGLKITRHYDERTNYYKSTRAAAMYLRDLHAEFGDWLLVLAAYNGGPGPVNLAIRKSGSRNFWALQHYLPAESRDHVKKFIATQYYFEGQRTEYAFAKAKKNNQDANGEHGTVANPVTQVVSRAPDHHQNEKPGINPPEIIKINKERESSDDKFKRIMKESEESLQKSKSVLKEDQSSI